MRKLMRPIASWKLLSGAALLTLLAGCPLPRHAPPPPTAVAAPVAAHEGRPFVVSGPDSLLTILVYRAGTLASLGHNHVIASHQLSGTVYLPADPARGSFELHLPVDSLTVDEPALRARQAGSDFSADVPDSAREGTRHNMLGEALLDAAQFPDIALASLALSVRGPGELSARVQSTVRTQVRSFSVPLHYQVAGGTLTGSAEFALRQSDLGLTPFSALLGALQVQDEMHISLQLTAHAAAAP
jgi:polyisoprenoid-binding protein YceI